jgi:hypothetical protein
MKEYNIPLTGKDLEGIAREMDFECIPHHEYLDAIMYFYLGKRNYTEMIETSHKFSCYEAEYLKVPYESNKFKELKRANEQRMWVQVLESFPDFTTHDFTKVTFTGQSDAQLKEGVKKRYERNP